MTKKILTKHQKKIEAQGLAKKYVSRILVPKLLRDIEVIVEDEETPEKHLKQGNDVILNKVLKQNIKK